MFWKSQKQRSQKHLAFVRTLPCVKTGISPCEAAHIRIGTQGGTGLKPSDEFVLPLSSEAHRDQHMHGERSFYKNIYAAKDLAMFIWEHTGDRDACAREIIRRRGELF